MRKIIIIQHCQSEHHINNMSGGWTDTPLTDLGRKQAYLIGTRLSKVLNRDEFTIYSSDLKRAKQTAEIIGRELGLVVNEDKELREINTGEAVGKSKEWVRQNRNPRTSDAFDLDYQEFEGGETWRQFYNRVCNCMTRLYNSEDKNLILATHGGTMGYIVAWWMGFKPEMLENSCFIASVGSLSILQVNTYNQHVLKVFNDTSHLSESS